MVIAVEGLYFFFLGLDYQTEGKTTVVSQEANSSLLCLQVELYTKGNGLYAATHHFFACKSYGTTISILLQPNQPQLNIL